jgi:hypothetical protein
MKFKAIGHDIADKLGFKEAKGLRSALGPRAWLAAGALSAMAVGTHGEFYDE